MADMAVADGKVRALLKAEVFQRQLLDCALERAVTIWQRGADGHRSGAERLQAEIARLDGELKNLAETAARGGDVPAILEALGRRQDERRRLAADLAALTRSASESRWTAADVHTHVRRRLADWDALLQAHPEKARALLDLALTDRIQFSPDPARGRYRLTIPIAFDRVIVEMVPELQGPVQEMMASPRGSDATPSSSFPYKDSLISS
jgi:hypothetical protein